VIAPHRARLVSVAGMQAIERATDAGGQSYAAMMEQAGAATARAALERFGPLPALVLVGPGNNGGDGLVCARVLHAAGCPARVYLWKRRTEPEHDYEGHFAAAAALGIEHASAETDPEFATLRAWLGEAGMLVDALLGTGANRPITGDLAALLETVQVHLAAAEPTQRLAVVAVDCPSGLDCDTGAADPHTLRADLTVTFAYAKQGHYRFPGAALVGELIVADIGVPPALGEVLRTFVLDAELLAPLLPERPRASHKGTFGKLMVAGGSVSFPGAVSLNLAAAGRVGTGLVTGAVPAPVWPVAAARLAEPTWVVLPAESTGAGSVAAEAAGTLFAALRGYDALLLGCGLTQQPGAVAFLAGVLAGGELPPTVLDADGLNCWARLEPRSPLPAQTIVTPHPAEMARLCAITPGEVTARAWELARARAAEWNAVVLLKGPYTVIAAPADDLAVLPVATPALATAGSGDVLAGAIAGLLAQGVGPFEAACLGAWLHGAAGRLCEAEIGPAGTVAGDLVGRLPRVMEDLRRRA
jgi:NAD(P)H-hydrate epimerase